MAKQSDWLLNGQLPRSVWEAAEAKYKKAKTSNKKIKAQQDWTGLNKEGKQVTIRFTVDNGGGGKLRPTLSSKAVLKEQLRDELRPKPKLSSGEKLFMKARAQAVQEYNAAHGYKSTNPKAAELDHIYGSKTPQHPAFIQSLERLDNQRKGSQASDAGYQKVDLSSRPDKSTKPKNGNGHSNGNGNGHSNGNGNGYTNGKSNGHTSKLPAPPRKKLSIGPKGASFRGVTPYLSYLPEIDEITGGHIDNLLQSGVNNLRMSLGFKPNDPNNKPKDFIQQGQDWLIDQLGINK